MGHYFHATGITVTKILETVEIAASGVARRPERLHSPSLLFRYLACGALR
jgi:hypothetical protein